MRHFDSATGVVTGDAELGVDGFGDRLPGLRLPIRRVISITTDDHDSWMTNER